MKISTTTYNKNHTQQDLRLKADYTVLPRPPQFSAQNACMCVCVFCILSNAHTHSKIYKGTSVATGIKIVLFSAKN